MLTLDIQEMTKRFSPEFKQQAINYTLTNSHQWVPSIA